MRKILCIIIIFVSVSYCFAGENTALELPEKENFHLFLLAGQSNMAGRGIVSEDEMTVHTRVLALSKDGTWAYALDPIHYDKDVAGVGLAKTFGVYLAAWDSSITIGLIPAACGGSSISTWKPGGYHKQTKSHPYDDAIARTQRAMEDGVLKAILWHQGESDSRPERASVYKSKLRETIEQLRKDLNAENLPFIIGQLGQFPGKPWDDSRKFVNEAHQSLARNMDNVLFVPSDGLSCKADSVHFNTKSIKEFGRRYAKAYLKFIKQ